MASTDAKPVPLKNVAFRVYFPILDADGDPVAGAAGLDSEVSKDGAAFADCTNEATEIGSSGFYFLDITATEMNADAVVVRVQTTTSGAKTSPIILYPEEDGDIRVNVTQFGGTAGTFAAGRPEVNTTHWGGAAVGSANVNANLTQILGTAPTEGAAGRLAGALTTLLDVAAPVLTAASVNQTGDSFVRIGDNGASLTSLGGMSIGMKAEAQIEAEQALQVYHLDHLIAAADPGGVVANNSFLAKLVSKSATAAFADYVNTTDSLQAIRDQGDAAWISATSVTVSAGGITAASFGANAIDAAALAADAANEIRDAVWAQVMSELASVPGVTGTVLEALEWCFLLSRNKVTQTATTQTLRNDADAASIATAGVSDDGTTFARNEWV